MRLSVTARIALLSIALALASNFAVILFVWKQTHDDAIATVRRDTVEQAEDFREIWRSGGDRALAAAVMRARQPGDVTTIVALLDGEGRHVLGTGPARVDTVPIAPTTFRIAHIASSAPWSEHEAGYALHRLGGYWLLNGSLLAVVEQEQRALESALAIAVLVSLILGVLGGLVLTRYVSARLVRIAGVVAAAGEGDLTRRVPLVAGGRDAFDRLAVRLNATLDRLERVMAELRVVTDSLAHDLRSPLARLRTKTEQAVLIADPAQREAALGGLLTETDLVMRMLTMVIEISRSEAVSRDRFTLVDPGELVEEIGELYEPVAEDQGVDLAVVLDVHPLPMMLHRELLSQAITNLIDNALKHAKGADVTLRLAAMADGLAIQVEDRGPGIAEADRAQALKRFGRLDSARTTPGAGLGMALIEAVARLHGGRFEMADNAPGLVARIVVPR